MRTWIQQNGHRGAKKPSRGACQTGLQKRGVSRRKCKQEGEGPETYSASVSGLNSSQGLYNLALSRVGEADNPCHACATARLFGAQSDAMGQRAATLTSKSEVELAPHSAQVGECRKMCRERFEKESFLLTTLIGRSGHPRHSQPYGSTFSPACFP